ncbi:Glycerophosphocholine phosphodiesterase [Podospora pseudocomata]|uniref:Glycerophosphocholine phosphodiesterase n=1 Tax=Podospora pseudocomata TaxID=2093779 RepID=A0ABR0GCT6_9PEZI|nr:Glycerophosphocholine phosphodiesterase [Podospora pseudocomata]
MRFGQNYHRNFVPEWSEHYVDYNLLKKHAKLGNIADIYEYLDNAVPALKAFYQHEINTDSFQQEDLNKLQWFERVNVDAIERIITKLKRNGHAGSPDPSRFAFWKNSRQMKLYNQQNGNGLQDGILPNKPRTANPLQVAIRNQDDERVLALVQDSKNLRYLSARGENALHVAAQLGRLDYTNLLLKALAKGGLNHDIPDISRGWTPLFFAAVDGHFDIVQLLLEAGSNQHKKDHFGWTAKEYAVFKGHLAVAGLFETTDINGLTGGPEQSPIGPSVYAPEHCREGEQIIIATLGSSRKDRVVTEVDLSYCSSSLIREQTVPILDKETMSVAGTVTFTFLIAKPYVHDLQGPQGFSTPEEWKTALTPVSSPPLLVGHRGTGQNLIANKHLQIGENTVGSFLSAATLGASFVEFDVQVTRDLQAVCFHDFSLSESGTDVPVHDLTLDQFLHASKIQSPHGNPLSMLGKPCSQDEGNNARPRSRSLGEQFEAGAIQIRDRMKHTVDFKLKGFKPNTRGEFIQDSFATLKDILTQLPEEIGLDIEIKYPRLHEAVDAGVTPVAIELNTFVDVALDTIRQHNKKGSKRKIVLSSFTPEICILLSLKQKAYPVFFITNAGKIPMTDMEVRAASVQVAVRFARRWNLTGIVFACEALLLSPRLVGYVKKKGGLVCATYGELNNQAEVVRKQVAAGVDIIVADRVRLVADTLAVLN